MEEEHETISSKFKGPDISYQISLLYVLETVYCSYSNLSTFHSSCTSNLAVPHGDSQLLVAILAVNTDPTHKVVGALFLRHCPSKGSLVGLGVLDTGAAVEVLLGGHLHYVVVS